MPRAKKTPVDFVYLRLSTFIMNSVYLQHPKSFVTQRLRQCEPFPQDISITDSLSPNKEGNWFVLAMVDFFIKVSKAEPMRSKDTKVVALFFLNR